MIMKNLFKTLAVVALGVMATSCVKDNVEQVKLGDKQTISMTVVLPDQLSRAIGDGTTAKNLYYTVFDENWVPVQGLEQTESITFNNELKASVELALAVGLEYRFTFWAAADGAPYTYDGKNVTVDFSAAVSNDEVRDAFFANHYIKVERGMADQSVTLKRPFAQVNFGTADWQKAINAGLTVDKTLVKTQSYTGFDLTNGAVTGSLTDVTFDANTLPQEELVTKNGDTYTWLAMNYLLVPSEKITLPSVEMEVYDYDENATNAISRTIQYQVPVQRNWRTHILGNLLIDQVIFFIQIDPIWEGEYFLSSVTNTANAISNVVIEVAADEGAAIDIDGELSNAVVDSYVWGEDYTFSGVLVQDATLKADVGILAGVTVSTIVCENVVFDCTDGAILNTAANSMVLYNCNFILPDGAYIINNTSGDTTMQVMVKDCKINGVAATADEIKARCLNVAWVMEF